MRSNPESRFLLNVIINNPPDCWGWAGQHNEEGRAIASVHGKNIVAARAVWKLMVGPIPEKMLICHHCDNPGCVNPSHLFLGTYKDNTDDCIKKNRGWWQKVTHCKHGHPLTAEKIGKFRRCKICQREWRREYKARRRKERKANGI